MSHKVDSEWIDSRKQGYRRIVFLTPDSHPIDRRVVAKADSLQSRGHEVFILAWRAKPADPQALVYGGIKTQFLEPKFDNNQRVIRAAFSTAIRVTDIPARLPVLVLEALERVLFGDRKLERRSTLKELLAANSLSFVALKASKVGLDRIASMINWPKNWLINSISNVVLRVDSKRSMNSTERAFYSELVFMKPDVIEANDFPCLRPAVLAKRKTGALLVYDMHEMYSEIETIDPIRRIKIRLDEKSLVKSADLCITVNPLLAKKLALMHGGREPAVIQNAVDAPDDLFSPGRPDLFRKEFPEIGDRKILLYQGWIYSGESRNLKKLVQSFRKVSDKVVLVMMGYGEVEYFRDLIREQNLGDHVFLRDAVSQDQLLYYTASADIGLIPYVATADLNTQCGSPNKLYEFIQARLPILSNDLVFVRSVLEAEGFGEVTQFSDQETLLQVLEKMIGSLASYQERLVEKGSMYAWREEEKKYVKLLEQHCSIF